MPPGDPALMTAETLLGHYGRRTLSPVDALKAVTERIGGSIRCSMPSSS